MGGLQWVMMIYVSEDWWGWIYPLQFLHPAHPALATSVHFHSSCCCWNFWCVGGFSSGLCHRAVPELRNALSKERRQRDRERWAQIRGILCLLLPASEFHSISSLETLCPHFGEIMVYFSSSPSFVRQRFNVGTILKLRKHLNLSQNEFAEKLSVTRQAVSRWENGETVPNIDTLKLIATWCCPLSISTGYNVFFMMIYVSEDWWGWIYPLQWAYPVRLPDQALHGTQPLFHAGWLEY